MLSTRPLTEIPPFNNVQNEIYDMVKPADQTRITLKDLINWFVDYFSMIFQSLSLSVVKVV